MTIIRRDQAAIAAKHGLALIGAKTTAVAAVVALITGITDKITGGVPLAEKLSWGSKEAAARAVLAATATVAEAAMIDAEAAITGEKSEPLARQIVANADAYRAVIATLAGFRRKAVAVISAADSPEAVAETLARIIDEAALILQPKD